jgi:microcystin-dependent protein
MSESYIGEIRAFAGNFAPEGWALCDGSLLAIASNTALFSLIGTTYGGDGQNTFALPDLRGRAVIHQGTGTGLSPYVIGEQVGTETVTLAAAQMQGTRSWRAQPPASPSMTAQRLRSPSRHGR